MITSTANRQIKNVIQLQKRAKERRKQGAFVMEGPRMVAETPVELLREIYVSERFLPDRDPETAAKLREWEHLGRGEIVTVSESVFAHMSDTATPQGILAVAAKPEYSLEEILDRSPAHLLLLEGIQDPGNLGTMVRTGEGAGITGILMSPGTVDLFSPKVVRSTMGSIYRVPFFEASDWEAALRQVKAAGVRLYAAHLRGTGSYDSFDYTGPSGFLIGNEGNGLTEETASAADALLKIPMEGRLESLNAAMAAGILMYETYRQRRNH